MKYDYTKEPESKLSEVVTLTPESDADREFLKMLRGAFGADGLKRFLPLFRLEQQGGEDIDLAVFSFAESKD